MRRRQHQHLFRVPGAPSYAGEYRSLGFDIVNQANNHALDYGSSGHSQTLAALKQAGVAYTGLPGQITYLNVKGTRVAFVGFAPYKWASDLDNIPAAEALVRRARAHAALVAVIIHAGAEGSDAVHTPHGTEYYLGENRGNPRAFAHGVINAGASIVLGSGPHVIRGVERYRGRMIAYSLGNFIGYNTLGLGGVLSDSAILRVTLTIGGKVLAGRWIPLLLEGRGVPTPDPSGESTQLMASLSREDFPSGHFTVGPRGTSGSRSELAPGEPAGRQVLDVLQCAEAVVAEQARRQVLQQRQVHEPRLARLVIAAARCSDTHERRAFAPDFLAHAGNVPACRRWCVRARCARARDAVACAAGMMLVFGTELAVALLSGSPAPVATAAALAFTIALGEVEPPRAIAVAAAVSASGPPATPDCPPESWDIA